MKIIVESEITVSPDRQRRLFDEAALAELRDSIEKFGLMHPLVVRPTGAGYVLVSGERRIRACRDIWQLGGNIHFDNKMLPEGYFPIVDIGELDPIEAEEAELDENLRRANLTWQEHAAVVARLQKLRNAQAQSFNQEPISMEDLAAEAFIPKRDGMGTGATAYGQDRIRKELVVAKYLDNADVRAAKTVDEAFKIVKRNEELAKSEALGNSVGLTFSRASHSLLKGDCLQLMGDLTPETFDVLLTDPPYGMGADAFGDSGGKTLENIHMYADDETTVKNVVLPALARASILCKPAAHAYVFCDIELFYSLREFFRSLGWKPFRTPLIWCKPDGRVPLPQHGPRRTYEMLLYAFRGDKPIRKVAADTIFCAPDTNLNLAAQKPVELFTQLLSRSCLPGDSVLDPFCGTGTVFPAAHILKVKATGIEMNPQTYGIAVERLEKL